MYRDLDATTWPSGKSIVDHPPVRRLLLTRQEEAITVSDTHLAVDRLDDTISVVRLDHIVDADSSQTVAIEMVRTGRDLVIQGPPGTAKSQTITNIIATAVLDGKKVLFVAEKLAALEVVKRRLEKEQLGVLCLELHSNKARKTDVANDLKLTWDLGKPATGTLQDLNTEPEKQRTSLNQHPQRLHRPLGSLKQSAFDFIGLLAKEGRPEGKEIGMGFSGAESWSQEQLKELQLRQLALGDLQKHSWRGVQQTVYFGTERPLLLEKLKAWQENTTALRQLTFTIQEQLQMHPTEVTVPQTERLHQLLQWASVHPTEKIASIAHPIWDNAGSTILKVAQNKTLFEAISTETTSQVLPSVWKRNLSPVRRQIVLNGKRWYRFLIGSYRKALAELQAQLSGPLPNSYAERLALVDQILAGQQAFQYIEAKEHTAREAFGLLWEADGNGSRLVAIAEWMQEGITRCFGIAERQAVYQADRETVARLSRQYAPLLDEHQGLSTFFQEKLQIDWTVYHQQAPDAHELTLSQRLSLLQEWLEKPDALVDWIAWQKQLKNCQNGPLAPLVSLAEQGYLPAKRLLVSFNRIWASQCLDHLFRQEEALADFDGGSHEKKIEQFRQLDKQRLHLAKVKVLDAHYGRIPEKRAVGMVGTVLGEVNKQRNHKPIRKLLKEAGAVIQNLKPVFMMSPLSVAQYLEPGAIEFDLLVIDEASQVQPVDALGAVARARQIVVVGDDKQLPPTMFFSKITSNYEGGPEDEPEEEGQVKAKELESILSLCKARGVPNTLLQWHYRSRHESLIAVSNQRYYENKLFIVPSPWKKNAGLGLKWHAVNGVYDRSNTRSNPTEAKEVALAVLNHARQHPEQTLGVAAFSMTQQRAIQDEVEVLRRSHGAEMEPFFAKHPYEPFFVKNLENVQGDERDVIFLSVGYGKDAEGRMFQNFGPLNKAGGERRLNVLISRARRCCEVFTSITDQDITLTEASSEGVVGLKHFLQYARTGIFDLAQTSGCPWAAPWKKP